MLKLQIIGNLGSDAEVKNFKGKNLASFSIAANEEWKDGNGVKRQKTTWVSCLYKHETVAPYLKKGTGVYVEGDLSVKVYVDSEGNHQAGLNMNVKFLQFVPAGSGSGKNNNESQGKNTTPPNQSEAYNPENLPSV